MKTNLKTILEVLDLTYSAGLIDIDKSRYLSKIANIVVKKSPVTSLKRYTPVTPEGIYRMRRKKKEELVHKSILWVIAFIKYQMSMDEKSENDDSDLRLREHRYFLEMVMMQYSAEFHEDTRKFMDNFNYRGM